MPNHGTCAGEEFAAFAGLFILSSYLVLFISFYLATYKKSGSKGNKTRTSLRRMSRAKVPDAADMQAIMSGAGHSASNGSANTSNGATTTGAKANGTRTRSRKA